MPVKRAIPHEILVSKSARESGVPSAPEFLKVSSESGVPNALEFL